MRPIDNLRSILGIFQILLGVALIVTALITLVVGLYKMSKAPPETRISKPLESKSTALQVFEEHMKTCPECNKEVDNPPPPICERGFELLQKALIEEKVAKRVK